MAGRTKAAVGAPSSFSAGVVSAPSVDVRKAYARELEFFRLVVGHETSAEKLIDQLFPSEDMARRKPADARKLINGVTKKLAIVRNGPVPIQYALRNLLSAVTELWRAIEQASHGAGVECWDRWLGAFMSAFNWFWHVPALRNTFHLLIGSVGATGWWHNQPPIPLEKYMEILRLPE